jgi:hypothetical protein
MLKSLNTAPRRRTGEWRYSSIILDLGTGGEWSASYPGRCTFRGKEFPVPTVQKTGWAPEPVCTLWRRE